MATITTSPQVIAEGNNGYFTVQILSWYDQQSGTTCVVHEKLRIRYTYGDAMYYGTNKNWSLDFGTTVSSEWPDTAYAGVDYDVIELTVTHNSGQGIGGRATFYSYLGGTVEISPSGWYVPTFASAPTGLSCANVVAGTDNFSATVSITDWGAGGTSTRWRELQVWTYSASGLVEPRRYQPIYGMDLSSTIAVNNQSTGASSPPLTISPNTRYVLGVYASNGTAYTGSQRVGAYYTICEAPLSVSLVSQAYVTYDTVNATITLTTPADGGGLAKTIQYCYATDGEVFSDWADSTAVVSSGAETSTTFDVTLPTSENITFKIRSVTSAGASEATSTSFTTLATHTGPSFNDFTYEDTNASTIAVTGDNQYLIQGLSTPTATVSVANKMVATDGVAPDKYVAILGDASTEAAYSDNEDVDLVLGTTTSSGLTALSVSAYDVLGASTTVAKNVTVLPYADPLIDVGVARIDVEGHIRLTVSGTYSPLLIGTPKNTLTIEFLLIKSDGSVPYDWQAMTVTTSGENFSAEQEIEAITYSADWTIVVRVTDAFSIQDGSVDVFAEDKTRFLYPAEFDIEIWDWKTNTYITDVTTIVTSDLSIDWQLNDVETIDFSLDLYQFEKRCTELGASPDEVLKPYVHDVRVRRNGVYIIGAQIVEANVQISNAPSAVIQVRCTGFLNLFKDQYVSEAWSGYSYAEIVQKIIDRSQKGECLIKNPTFDVDISYWLSGAGSTLSYSTTTHSGDGALFCRQTSGWGNCGSEMSCGAGTPIVVDLWIWATAGAYVRFRERYLMTTNHGQSFMYQTTGTGTWEHIHFESYTIYENGYFLVEARASDASQAVAFYLDDCYVYKKNDYGGVNNMGVVLNQDTASAYQDATRQVSYELQNAKDAILELPYLQDDNFDFAFNYDRSYNLYARKGADRMDIEASFPGNIDNLQITRSAANLANKIISLGSGIGDEKLQTITTDRASRELYGTRESVVTNNNTTLIQELKTASVGKLFDSKDPTNLPSVTIADGSIHCGNIEVGDSIPVIINDDSYLESASGLYRVVRINASISQEHRETMRLTLEPPLERPAPVMVRYIKDSITGSSATLNKHWVQIQALMMVGNSYQNLALHATVSGSTTILNASAVVDGHTSTRPYAYVEDTEAIKRSIIIDLGAEYPIDYVKIWHFYEDYRVYYGGECSVGATLTAGTDPLEHILWTYPDSPTDTVPNISNLGIQETSQGRLSQWIQGIGWEDET